MLGKNMKIFNLYIAALLFIFFMITSCSGPGAVRNDIQKQKSSEKGTVMNEDFDPLSLGDYTVETTEKKDTKTTFYDINHFIKSDNQDSVNTDELVAGYRVCFETLRYSIARFPAWRREIVRIATFLYARFILAN